MQAQGSIGYWCPWQLALWPGIQSEWCYSAFPVCVEYFAAHNGDIANLVELWVVTRYSTVWKRPNLLLIWAICQMAHLVLIPDGNAVYSQIISGCCPILPFRMIAARLLFEARRRAARREKRASEAGVSISWISAYPSVCGSDPLWFVSAFKGPVLLLKLP